MKTAEEILKFELWEGRCEENGELPQGVKDAAIKAMKAYATEVIDKILLKERGDVVPESEILKIKYNLK